MESFRRTVLKKRLRNMKIESMHIIEDDSMDINMILINYKKMHIIEGDSMNLNNILHSNIMLAVYSSLIKCMYKVI